MLKKILTAIAIFILVFVLVGAMFSREFDVTRKVVVNAEPAKIHALVGELKRWDEWTPWLESDPTIVTTFGPTTSGVGASQTWTGKDGDGRLTFTQADPVRGIDYDMVFIDGEREMPSKGWIHYTPVTGGMQVEWGMTGVVDMPVVGGYFAAMMDLMVGGMFERGLEKLKARTETP